jgi:hypothetical protein
LDRTGLLAKITASEISIDRGRRLLDTKGLESSGRAYYRDGLKLALKAFKEANAIADTDIGALILAEYIFLTQELRLCDSSDAQVVTSLTQAIQSFDDAFLSLKAASNPNTYQYVEPTYPHHPKYRIKGMPKDAFHIACVSHRTRIGNILRSPGINLAEKELLIQRRTNLAVAQAVYLGKQKSALSASSVETIP